MIRTAWTFLRAAWRGRRVFSWQDWIDATDRRVMIRETRRT